jgi:hypothetical protein
MTTSIGTTGQVYAILGRTTNDVAEIDVLAKLQEAERLIQSQHSVAFFTETFYTQVYGRTRQTLRNYKLYFPIKSGQTPTVFVNGVQAVVTTDFTFSANTVVFVSDFLLNPGDRISFQYIPAFFDDYANYLAAMSLYSIGMVDTTAGVSKAIYDELRVRVTEYKQLANSYPHIARMTDHRQQWGIW